MKVNVPLTAWIVFAERAAYTRTKYPRAGIPDGDKGTRLFLRHWIEARLKDAF